MVWIVSKDCDNKVCYENPDSGEMTRKKPSQLIEAEEKQEKEHLEEYQRITNEIDGMKNDLTVTDQNINKAKENIKEAQQTIIEEKHKRIEIEHDIENLNEELKSLEALWKPNGRIEEQPAEILLHIFKQMFDLKTITKCYNTNSRWRQIVEKTFENNCKFTSNSNVCLLFNIIHQR